MTICAVDSERKYSGSQVRMDLKYFHSSYSSTPITIMQLVFSDPYPAETIFKKESLLCLGES